MMNEGSSSSFVAKNGKIVLASARLIKKYSKKFVHSEHAL